MGNCDGGRIIEEKLAFCYLGDLREAFESPSVPQCHCACIYCMCKFERKEWVNICCVNSRHMVKGFRFYFPFLTEDFHFGSSVKEWRNKLECTAAFSTVPRWVKATFQKRSTTLQFLFRISSVLCLFWIGYVRRDCNLEKSVVSVRARRKGIFRKLHLSSLSWNVTSFINDNY